MLRHPPGAAADLERRAPDEVEMRREPSDDPLLRIFGSAKRIEERGIVPEGKGPALAP